MKIKTLEICGFKSFVDRTVLHFKHDITAVVGPNGCGKSNIVDAIRWTMGEQSAQRLRGKAMEDVIFNGSEARGAHGFAEVSITFDNADGLTPPEYKDYAEITVTRRLSRDGASDYLINRTPVRLLDVTNLFLGTGIGKRAYSIIEQGKVGYIVSSKPEDRRQILEEAAGITKFKARKKAAERKMDLTRQNLVRVTDITTEIERNLASLKRQAQKAERYKAYRAEVRDLELLVASHRWLELTVQRRVIGTELDTVSASLDGARTAMRVREAEIEVERAALHEVEARVEQSQNRAYELDNEVRMLEGRISQQLERLAGLRESERLAERELSELQSQRETLATEKETFAQALVELEAVERAEAEVLARETEELERRRAAANEAEQAVSQARARITDAQTRIARAEAVLAGFERRRDEARARVEKLHAEREELDARTVELEQRDAELHARLEGLHEGKQATAARRAQVEAELNDLRAEIQKSDRTVAETRDRLAERRSRLRSLEEIQARFEGVGAGVRALMTKYASNPTDAKAHGIVGLLADRLDCPHELTGALAGVLGERLQHVVIENMDAGVRALDLLRAQGPGRATLMPRAPRRMLGAPAAVPSGEGIVGCLADLVGYAAEDEWLVRHLLGRAIVVDSLPTALRLHGEAASELTFVTREGDVLEPDGTMSGGSGEDVFAHMLHVKREIRELHAEVNGLDAALTVAVERHGELRKGIAQRQASLDAARSEAHDSELAIVAAEKDVRRLEDERQRTKQRIAVLETEVAELVQSIELASDEEGDARAEIEASQAAHGTASEEHEALLGVYEQRRGALDEQSELLTEVRVRAAQAQQRAQSDRAAMERLERSIEELDAREERLRGDVTQGAVQQGVLAAHVLGSREELTDAVASAMVAHERLGEERVRYDEARNAILEQEGQLKEIRASIDTTSTRVNELTLSERELSLSMQHLLEQIAERHRVDLRRVLGDYHARELPGTTVKSRVDELLRLIERMGEINLMAIEEFEEQSKRYESLTTQQKDLEQALEQLESAIRRMNRESRQLFRETFHEVNERFKRVFPRMFGGGRAELRLTDPEDLLESGVEIIAQPPGKKLGSLELMSGGEKALTAVSLIFAIFQYKPSPFCLLDEVDAPLDEANVGRFTDAVREMTDHSQFIVITHSKRTMESADVLYGVTMEQPGISKLVSVELRGERLRKHTPPTEHVAVA